MSTPHRPRKRPRKKTLPDNMTPSESNSSPSIQTEDTQDQQHSAFLALPLEVRMSIYHFLDLTLPSTPSTSCNGICCIDDECEPVLPQRRSLLHVCRQMHEDWAPFFYRRTVIVVNGTKLTRGSACFFQERLHFSLTEFNSRFLKHLPEYKLSSIRRLIYDVSLPKSNSTDWPNVRKLSTILHKNPGMLGSLLELTISSTCFPYVIVQRDELRGLPEQQREEQTWGMADRGGKWDIVLEVFSGILSRWNITKEIRMGYRSGYNRNCGRCSVKELKITWGKPENPGEVGANTFKLHLP